MPLRQPLAAYYRAAAANARRLLIGATTPWLKERLGAEIGRCERIAEEIERAPDAEAQSPGGEHVPAAPLGSEATRGRADRASSRAAV
jgi:hypothetical protein